MHRFSNLMQVHLEQSSCSDMSTDVHCVCCSSEILFFKLSDELECRAYVLHKSISTWTRTDNYSNFNLFLPEHLFTKIPQYYVKTVFSMLLSSPLNILQPSTSAALPAAIMMASSYFISTLFQSLSSIAAYMNIYYMLVHKQIVLCNLKHEVTPWCGLGIG